MGMEAQGRAIEQAVTIAQVSLVALQRAKPSNSEVGHTVGSFKDSLALKFNVEFILDLTRDKNNFFRKWVLPNMSLSFISFQR